MEIMVWIILAFTAGLVCGVLCAKVFFPNLATRYKVIEKVVEKSQKTSK